MHKAALRCGIVSIGKIIMPFIPSSVPKLPLSMEPSRGKMMKSDNPAPDSKAVDAPTFCTEKC